MARSSTPGTVHTEVRLSTAQLADATHISRSLLARLVSLGVIDPPEAETGEFTSATAARLRRMLRLRRDLHVNLVGATIILDLLERLDRLEAELARARHGTSE